MLTIKDIEEKVSKVARDYPITKVSLFGSYADNKQNEHSDVDFFVEFVSPSISLFVLSEIKYKLQDELNINVDIIHAPLKPNSMIIPREVIDIYVR